MTNHQLNLLKIINSASSADYNNPSIFQIGPDTAQKHYKQKGFFLCSQNIEKCRFCTCSLGALAHICLL